MKHLAAVLVCVAGCVHGAATRDAGLNDNAAAAPAQQDPAAAAPPAIPVAPAPAPAVPDAEAPRARASSAVLFGLADLDPDNDGVVAPPDVLADCEAELTRAGVEFGAASFPLAQKRGNVFTCGSEQAVVYRRGPQKFRFNARPQLTCRMALGLARFEHIAAEEAMTWLGRKIRKVAQGGTYSCRRMQRFRDMVSEHSYANAIDIRAFELDDGQTISVLAHFGPLTSEPDAAASRFLRSLSRRLYDEQVFSVVLTPYFDALHRDHFHLDQARYRLDGTR